MSTSIDGTPGTDAFVKFSKRIDVGSLSDACDIDIVPTPPTGTDANAGFFLTNAAMR